MKLVVGALSYPTRRPPVRPLQRRLTADVDPTELRVDLEGEAEVATGRSVSSAIRLRNLTRSEVVVVTTGSLIGWVTDPATGDVVGSLVEGLVDLVPVRFPVPAGGSTVLPLLIGTTSFRPELGYAVPPGEWAVSADLNLEDGRVLRDAGDGDHGDGLSGRRDATRQGIYRPKCESDLHEGCKLAAQEYRGRDEILGSSGDAFITALFQRRYRARRRLTYPNDQGMTGPRWSNRFPCDAVGYEAVRLAEKDSLDRGNLPRRRDGGMVVEAAVASSRQDTYPGGDHDDDDHDNRGDGMPAHHAARREYKMVRATIPFPARPMETITGLDRPGTLTLTTRAL